MRLTRLSSVALSCAASIAAAVAIASCGGSSGPTSTNTTTIGMTASASGNGQTAAVGTALALPLRVMVLVNGTAQSGLTVMWAAVGAGASVNPAQSTTDVNGVATTTWTLGSTVGTQSATATLAGATGSPVTFTATATALVPVIGMTASASGNGQTDSVTATLPNPLRVVVMLNGAVQAGDTVTWATPGTGAVTPSKAVTDASGIATTSWKLGQTAGAQSATATLAGATGSPVTFNATATPGKATQLTVASGDNQTGFTNAAIAPLMAKVADQFGNGVAGVVVRWQVTSGSASLSADSTQTDATGIAQTVVTFGTTAGAVSVTAVSAGLTGSPLTFSETSNAPPAADTVHIGDDFFKSGRNGTQNPAVDTVAAGGKVTWIWGGTLDHSVQSTGSPSFTSSVIQTSGTYTFTFSTAGTYTYDCAVHGLAMTGKVVVVP